MALNSKMSLICAQNSIAKDKDFHTNRILPFSQKVDLALFFLSALHKHDTLNKNKDKTPLSVKTIAKKNNISFYFLQKIAVNLKKAGIIRAIRGKAGGYNLTRKAEEISLKDVIEGLEGHIAIVPCLREHHDRTTPLCERESCCQMKQGMEKMNKEIENILQSHSLMTLIS